MPPNLTSESTEAGLPWVIFCGVRGILELPTSLLGTPRHQLMTQQTYIRTWPDEFVERTHLEYYLLLLSAKVGVSRAGNYQCRRGHRQLLACPTLRESQYLDIPPSNDGEQRAHTGVHRRARHCWGSAPTTRTACAD